MIIESQFEIRHTNATTKRSTERLTDKLGPWLRFYYEAGPCGLGLLR